MKKKKSFFNRKFDDIYQKSAMFNLIKSRSKTVNSDPVSHPFHYNQGIECAKYVDSHKMDFFEGNAIKYITRLKFKNGIEDLKKAIWNINFIVEREENKTVGGYQLHPSLIEDLKKAGVEVNFETGEVKKIIYPHAGIWGAEFLDKLMFKTLKKKNKK